MKRRWLCLSVFLLGCGALLVAAPPDAADDVQDMVLLADQGPVLLRLHLQIDGKPFQAVHKEALDGYLAALFHQLDADGDGKLNEEEARRMPPPFKPPADPSAAAVNVAFNYRVVDADGDGRVTREELADYFRQFGGGPVQLQPAVRTAASPAVDEALFALLDTNKDGKLSRDELAAAATVLFPLDQDHDELLTPQELVPSLYAANVTGAPIPAGAMPAAPAARPSLIVVSADDDRAGLAATFRARYGARGADELAKFTDRPADVELMVRLGARAEGQAPLEVIRADGKPSPKDGVRLSADGGLMLNVAGARVELRVNQGRPAQPPGTRQHILALFHGLDASGKGRLTRNAAQQNGFFPDQFALLDQNGDGILTERELTAYLDEVQDRQARLFAATPALLASNRGQGLFEWLDRDRDGRLSLRELREAPKLLARLGREAEGDISREDLTECYQVAVGLGQASLGPAGPAPFSPREAPMLTLDWAGPNLLWFYKMDRNRDGDISPREFLGTAEDFKRLDADGDGLISREEAERAEGLFKKK